MAATAAEGKLDVPGGHVWHRLVGAGNGFPVVLLHGGPGASSHYLEPLAELADERPVLFYDQLGCGRSERPDDPSLWRTERFVEELASVRSRLGIEELHLFGHSWGAVVAVEYMRTRPRGVASLILASPALDVPRWHEDAMHLRARLPAGTRAALDRHEAAGTTESAEYEEAKNDFYKRHFCRREPWPPELETSLSPDQFGSSVYEAMWGPNEFTVSGSLRSFDAMEQLTRLELPVLYTTGRFDLATPDAVLSFQQVTPSSRLLIFEQSGHMTMHDEREAYLDALRHFLRDVERSR
jgi:proline iminopeptidase